MMQESKLPKKLMNVQEIAEYLGVKTSYIYYVTRLKKIPVIKIGNHSRYDAEEVLKHYTQNSK
jgi:excisionase family DNA binding protein